MYIYIYTHISLCEYLCMFMIFAGAAWSQIHPLSKRDAPRPQA